MEPRIHDWADLPGAAIDRFDRDTTVVTVACSPLEVHGPHLPTKTDFCEADGLTRAALAKLQDRHPELQVLRLPPLYVATDVLPHTGSVAFRPSTVRRVLQDMGRSLAAQGFKHIWVSSFHGGPRHFVPIEMASDHVNRRHGASMVSIFGLLISRLTQGGTDLTDVLGHLDGLNPADLVGDSHGGVIETSMMLHLAGDNVDPCWKTLPQQTVETVRAAEGKSPPAHPLADFKEKLFYYHKYTYSGRPETADPALGAVILDELAGHCADALSELWTGAIAPDSARSPLWPARWLFASDRAGAAFERLIGYRSRVW